MMIKINKCRYPECGKVGNAKDPLRKGLCNKHRKWVAKNLIDKDTLETLPGKELPKERRTICKIDGCTEKHKAKGFCKRHYISFKINKTINEEGDHIGKRYTYSDKDVCKIKGCDKKDKLIKGFCKYHYGQYTRGILSLEGFKLRDLKKVAKYGDEALCKGEDCQSKPRVRGFCANCVDKIQRGTLDPLGKKTSKSTYRNKGKTCSSSECDKEAYSKGMCLTHYYRVKTNYLGSEGYKNIGKICSEDNCNEPAEARTLCNKHYRALLREEQGIPKKEPVNKDKMCRVNHCHNKAYSRALCVHHYSLFKRKNSKDIIQNIKVRPDNYLKQSITINSNKCETVGCSEKPYKDNLCKFHYHYFKTYKPDDLNLLRKRIRYV